MLKPGMKCVYRLPEDCKHGFVVRDFAIKCEENGFIFKFLRKEGAFARVKLISSNDESFFDKYKSDMRVCAENLLPLSPKIRIGDLV